MSKGMPLTTIEKERVKSLTALGLSNYAIAKQMNRESRTIAKVSREPNFQEEVAERAAKLALLCENNALRLFTFSDEDIAKLNVYQRSISGGIAVDKSRLLRGLSTENVGVGVDITARLQDALKRGKVNRDNTE